MSLRFVFPNILDSFVQCSRSFPSIYISDVNIFIQACVIICHRFLQLLRGSSPKVEEALIGWIRVADASRVTSSRE